MSFYRPDTVLKCFITKIYRKFVKAQNAKQQSTKSSFKKFINNNISVKINIFLGVLEP